MKQQKGILWLTETLALLSGKRKLSGCECMLWPSPEQRESQRHSGPRLLLRLPLTGMKAITSGWVITGPWVTSPKRWYKSSRQPSSLRERMYAVKAWQTSCGGGNARRSQVCVQGNSSSGECSFPLWCRWGCNQPAFISEDRLYSGRHRAALHQFRGIVFVECFDGRQMFNSVCKQGLTSCKNTTVTNFSSGGLILDG